MRLLKLLILLFAFSLPLPMGGQTVTVSEEISLRSDYIYDVLGKYQDHILLVRDGLNEFDVQAYDEDMFMDWDVAVELDSRRSRIIEFVPRKSSFNIVYSDERKDTMWIMSREYDGKAKLLHTDTLLFIKKGLLRPKFRYVKSEDRNIFLMTEIENERIKSAFAFDLSTRRLLWESKFEFKEINFREEYRKTIISNDGTMFLIFEKNNYRFKKEQHTFEIAAYNKVLRNFNINSIPVPEFTTYDAYFRLDNLNHHLNIVGLYSDKNSAIAEGLFHIKFDLEKLSEFKISKISFDEELIADFHGKYNPKKESLYNLDLQDVILRQDGGILLIAEENKEYERLSYGARRDYYSGNRFSVDYYYEDIVLVSLHPDGQSHWQKLLPKRQYSNDDDAVYSSYFLFKNPTSLRILYNDEIRNENTVSEYILNGAGDISRRSLMSTDNQKLKLQIKNAVQTDSNEVVMPSVRGKKLRLVRLRY